MKKKMYSVRDDIAEVFAQPFPSINDATALRDFKNGAVNSDMKNDLTLFCIGEFNDSNGLLVPLTAPRRMVSGMEFPTLEEDEMLEKFQDAASHSS